MRQPNTDSRYATLDGLRGAAAMVVVFVHFHALYHLPEIEHGYLAVDLFFAMSGFVIANAYDRKLSSGELNWQKYFVLRLFRLYPLYFAGLALGVAALAYRLPASDWHQIASAVPGSLLMMPSHAPLRTFYPLPEKLDLIYPLDFPAWSLFFELTASLAYGLFFRHLTTRVLVFIMCASGVLLGIAAYTSGLSNGVSWPTFYVGFARLGYAFPAGLLLYRFHRPARRRGSLSAIVIVVLAVGLLFMPWSTVHQPAVDLLIALIALPAIVWAACRVEPPARLLSLFAFSGAISYAVYVLHVPFAFMVQDFAYRSHLLQHPSGVSAVILLPGIVLLTWSVDRYYDTPVRRALLARSRGWLAAHPKRAAAADATMPQ
ncbi:acyltransferase family protein [Paraburkholderia lycopersici]|uniref:Peptidoglycan/LPS O-acetylase OafA/YrhL, contains acyltransferase and SGNH-hydrolase domains n=1 Tax=Paraburkholderia lycopersici TaxID=416944 RepID=A0A1G6YUK7_9BURK|nr:acyltransferase [Paraburkholderia lycopersici]SDD93327.1 Peptidoglycan/LPS O-acetylase OafA/YrhL, contains acyltransferase and SGNH-hydrolase domains [Paraburkholderia lycopersici]